MVEKKFVAKLKGYKREVTVWLDPKIVKMANRDKRRHWFSRAKRTVAMKVRRECLDSGIIDDSTIVVWSDFKLHEDHSNNLVYKDKSACNNPNCLHCEFGHYDRCPNNK